MKTTLSENQLNKLISESIKKNLLKESVHIDFENNLPKNSQNFTPKQQEIFDNLQKGYYGKNATRLYQDLQSLGYTPEDMLKLKIEDVYFNYTGGIPRMQVNPRLTDKLNKNFQAVVQNGGKRPSYTPVQNSSAVGSGAAGRYVQMGQGVNNGYNSNTSNQQTTTTSEPTNAATNQGQKGAEPAGIQSGVNNWNALGVVEQIRLIQRAVGLSGADADGRVGPQTTASIVRALINKNSTIDNELAQKNIGAQSFTDKYLKFERGKKTVYNQPISV